MITGPLKIIEIFKITSYRFLSLTVYTSFDSGLCSSSSDLPRTLYGVLLS